MSILDSYPYKWMDDPPFSKAEWVAMIEEVARAKAATYQISSSRGSILGLGDKIMPKTKVVPLVLPPPIPSFDRRVLNPLDHGKGAQDLEQFLLSSVIQQPHAVDAVMES